MGSKFPLVFGFDRLTLWLDRSVPGLKMGLDPYCREVTVIDGAMTYNSLWKCKVEIFQPSHESLLRLPELIGLGVRAVVTYAELAFDALVEDQAQADKLLTWLLAHVYVLNLRKDASAYKSTLYFGKRTAEGADKRGRVFVMYADKPSKLQGPHAGSCCVHTEMRFTGGAELATVGIASISDLPGFNHRAYWLTAIRLLDLGKKTALGEILASLDGIEGISQTALVKRANVLIERASIDKKFAMHNAVRKEAELLKKLPKVATEKVLGKNRFYLPG